MSLEELATDRPRVDLKLSSLVLAAWVIWLCFVSTLSISSKLSIPCTALVLIFGCFYWRVVDALFLFLVLGFIYRSFTLTPPALFWVALSIVFVLLKLVMFRLSIRTIPQLLTSIFVVALMLDITQWMLLRMVADVPVWSWTTLGGIVFSAFVQMLIGLIVVKPLLILVAHK